MDLSSGTSLVNHRTPLAERWGGWYVTGTHGNQTHRGNLIGKAAFERQEKEPNFLGNVTNLSRFFDVTDYALPQSDIVALMVLEHQTHMHNFITRLNYEATLTLSQYGHIKYLNSITEAFLKYLLFTEEVPLTASIHGSPKYQETFTATGPKDKQGRSLRDFDLQTRLFKYPCSYLIYSEAFDHLPGKIKASLYRRLRDILTGKDASENFQNIPLATRQAILEILLATKKDMADSLKSEP